jgi:hypothetical protein
MEKDIRQMNKGMSNLGFERAGDWRSFRKYYRQLNFAKDDDTSLYKNRTHYVNVMGNSAPRASLLVPTKEVLRAREGYDPKKVVSLPLDCSSIFELPLICPDLYEPVFIDGVNLCENNEKIRLYLKNFIASGVKDYLDGNGFEYAVRLVSKDDREFVVSIPKKKINLRTYVSDLEKDLALILSGYEKIVLRSKKLRGKIGKRILDKSRINYDEIVALDR